MSKFLKVGYYKERLYSGNKKELIFESLLAIVIRVGGAIASFLMNLVVARQLGPFDSGGFFLCFTVITVLSMVVRMGGDNLLIKNVSIYRSEEKWKTVKAIVAHVAKKTFVFSAIITVVLLVFHGFIAKDVFHKEYISGTLLWMLLSMPLFASYTLFSYAFQGLNKVLFSVFIQNIIVPVSVCLLTLILRPANSVELAKLYFVCSVFTVLLTLFLWNRNVPRSNPAEEVKFPDNLWKSSYAMWASALFSLGMQWGGQFIAGIFCPQRQFAQLAVAQRTSMLITFILVAVNLVSAPKFASLYRQGQSGNLKRYAINSTRLMVFFATPMVLMIICFPKSIMELFGPGFVDGAPMLVILSLGQYINVLTGSVTLLLMMSGHEKDMRNIQFMGGLLCVVLNYILVRTNGVFGAAVAIAISVSVQNLVCVGMVKKRLGFNTLAIWSRK